MYESVGVLCVPIESVSDSWGYQAVVSPDAELVCGCQFVSITDTNLESMEMLCLSRSLCVCVCVRVCVCVCGCGSLTWVI